ncbi:MAG: hypothetical protein AAF361_04025 [Bacteroidota bacterium]
MNKLEKLEGTLRYKMDGIVVDYHLQFDASGAVYESRALLFDLPENTRRLVLGNDPDEKKKKIENFRHLIPLVLPLGIVNQDSFFSEELAAIYKIINNWIAEKQLSKKGLCKLTVPKSLAYYALTSHYFPSQHPDDFNKHWPKIIELIENRDDRMKMDHIRYLGYYYPQFGFKVLTLLIPFIQQANTKRVAYEYLKHYRHKKCLDYLLKELDTCQNGTALGGIFQALSAQVLRDMKIQDKVIEIYYSDIHLDESSKANIMGVLKHFPFEQSLAVGVDILKGNQRHSSGAAARALLEMGYPAGAIADIMLPKLYEAHPKESEAAFSIFCNSSKYSPFLPDYKELLDIYTRTLSVKQNLNIAYAMPSLMRREFNGHVADKIVAYLSSEDANVLEGILILIMCLINDSNIRFKPFKSNYFKERCAALLDHSNRKVVENALNVLKRAGLKEADGSYIEIFIDKINFETQNLNNLHAMRAINHILPAVAFNDAIVEKYLEALKISNNRNYRVAAVKGLRYSDDIELKKSLAYLKDDPSEEVRREVAKIMEPVRRGRPYRAAGSNKILADAAKAENPSLLRRWLRRLYILIKYRGRKPTEMELFLDHLNNEVKKGKQKQKARRKEFELK